MNQTHTCSVADCDRPTVAKGLCTRHYQQARFGIAPKRRKTGPHPVTALTPINGKCGVAGCEREPTRKGMCELHYRRAYHYGDVGDVQPVARHATEVPCSVAGCDKPARGHGLCGTHYRRFRVHGAPGEAALLIAPAGSGYTREDGYRTISVDGRTRFEHQVVMERKLGRALRRGENVHHLDGNRSNSDPENLELWTHHQPAGQRVADKVRAAIKLLREHPAEAKSQGVRLLNLESQEATDYFTEEDWGDVAAQVFGLGGN